MLHTLGFVQISYDSEWVQPTLASNVSSFLSQNPHLLPKDANLAFVWQGKDGIEKALKGEAGNPEWTRRCMYVSASNPILRKESSR